MQITLEQIEIEEAIKLYLKDQGIQFGCEPTTTLTAGRGPSGITASIDISQITRVAVGPGTVEVMAVKKVDVEPFTEEEVPETIPMVPIKRTRKPKVVVDTTPLVEEEIPMEEEGISPFGSDSKEEDSTAESLFGEVSNEETPVDDEVTAESLFAS